MTLFNIQPSEFWAMTLIEWFWIVAAKIKANKAEQDAVDQSRSGNRKIKVPNSVWHELRAELKEREIGKEGSTR